MVLCCITGDIAEAALGAVAADAEVDTGVGAGGGLGVVIGGGGGPSIAAKASCASAALHPPPASAFMISSLETPAERCARTYCKSCGLTMGFNYTTNFLCACACFAGAAHT